MVARVGGERRFQPPGGAVRQGAVDAAGHDGPVGAEHGLQLGAVGHVLRPVDAPHDLGELVIAAEHHLEIARPGAGAVGGEGLSRGGPLQHHGAVVAGHGGGGGQHRPAPHGMALQADIGRVHHGQAAQVSQPRRTAEARGKGRPAAVAVTGLVHGQHHIAPPGELDGKAVLGLAAVDVAVHGQDARGPGQRRGGPRQIEQPAHHRAVAAGKAHVLHLDPVPGLDLRPQPRSAKDHGQSGQRGHPSLDHARHFPASPVGVTQPT